MSCRVVERGELFAGAAGGAGEFLAHVVEAALRGGYPVVVGVRGIVANVLLMATLEFGDPIAVSIHVKTDDFALRAGRYRARRFHIGILRPLGCSQVNFW